MSTYLALDERTNDLMLQEGGGLVRTSGGRFTVQQVRSKLRTILGEYAPDRSRGWVNFDDFTKNPDAFDIETRAREIILGTEGVLSIESMEVVLTSRRDALLTFTAKTQYGVVYESLPWGIGE